MAKILLRACQSLHYSNSLHIPQNQHCLPFPLFLPPPFISHRVGTCSSYHSHSHPTSHLYFHPSHTTNMASLTQQALKLSVQPRINAILSSKKQLTQHISKFSAEDILSKAQKLPDADPGKNRPVNAAAEEGKPIAKKTEFTYFHNKTPYKQKLTHPLYATNFFYSEGTECLYASKLGVAKMRLPSCFLTFQGATIKVNHPYFETAGFRYKHKPKNTMLPAERHLRYFIHHMNYLAKRRFQLRGRGYKMFHEGSNLAFKINYAHLVYHMVKPGLKLYEKPRENEWHVMAGLFPDRVGYETWRIQQYRIPNTYVKTGKGFFRFGVPHLFKEPKKTR